jgi:Ras-related protein Rab-21
VYDVNSEDSFLKIQKWIKELKNIVGEEIVCIIVGNKCDLINERKINFDLKAHEDFAESVGAKHFLVSAKLNENIDEVFLEISKDMIKKSSAKNADNSLNRSNSMRRQLRVEESTNAEDAIGVGEPANSKCCGR